MENFRHLFGGKSPAIRFENKRKKIFKLLKNDLNKKRQTNYKTSRQSMQYFRVRLKETIY